MGPLILLFWTSGDVSSGFQNHGGQLYLHLAKVYVLLVPWDSPLVQHLLTCWQLSYSLSHTCKQAYVGSAQANVLPTELYRLGWSQSIGNLYLFQGPQNMSPTGGSRSVVRRYVVDGTATSATRTVSKATSLLTGKTISQSDVILKSAAQTIKKGNTLGPAYNEFGYIEQQLQRVFFS